MSSSREDYFDQSLVRLLSRVASSMGVLIDNARLFAMEQSNSALLGALFRIASALTGPQPFADKAQAALDEISNLAGDAHVTLMVLDTNEQVLRSLVSAKQGRPTAPITSTVRLDASVVGECYFKGLPVIANTHAARDDAHDQVIAAGVEPVLALPVRLDGQLAAVLVATSTEPDHFSANAQSTLESVAEALGSLLENARNRNAWTRRW